MPGRTADVRRPGEPEREPGPRETAACVAARRARSDGAEAQPVERRPVDRAEEGGSPAARVDVPAGRRQSTARRVARASALRAAAGPRAPGATRSSSARPPRRHRDRARGAPRPASWTGASRMSASASSSDGTPRPREPAASSAHGASGASRELAERAEDEAPVGVQLDEQPALAHLADRPQELQAGPRLAEGDERVRGRRRCRAPRRGWPSPVVFDPSAALRANGTESPDPAGGRPERVVVDDERPIGPAPVRVGEDVLDDRAVRRRRRRRAGSRPRPAYRRARGGAARSRARTARSSSSFGCSSRRARRNSIPYFSAKPSIWPWPIIGSPGSVARSVATPKYLSPVPNCSIAVSSSGFVMKFT